MTKKSVWPLSSAPIDLSEQKETPTQRLTKLKRLRDEEKSLAMPCKAYIEDLTMSINRLEGR